jgi:fatty acid desaturase
MYVSKDGLPVEPIHFDVPLRGDPRAEMARRLPKFVQPFLTWLTAKPAPGEAPVPRKPIRFVIEALSLVLGGVALSMAAQMVLRAHDPFFWALLGLGLLATTSGLGVFQVVIFHHCSHGTVFSTRERNRAVGRLISALLLFKHFDAYQREHMLHHNANKLFTDDDEFTDFVVGICDLTTRLDRRGLWLRLAKLLVSPVWHASFLFKRLRGSLRSQERLHNRVGAGFLLSVFAIGLSTHTLGMIAVAWLLPLTVLLQVATVFRILCEHRLPPAEVIAARGPNLVCQATAGVFAGAIPPQEGLTKGRALVAWTGWWANMLTWQVFVRLFVLVGDAPCHDFHHRRPGKRWTDYTHNRQLDLEAGSPGFPLNYTDSWGLLRAIDQNFAAMERAPADLLS